MRVKTRYLKGVLTPLDPPLDLEEGAVVELEIVASHPWSLDWAISEIKEDLERICRLPDDHPKKYKLFPQCRGRSYLPGSGARIKGPLCMIVPGLHPLAGTFGVCYDARSVRRIIGGRLEGDMELSAIEIEKAKQMGDAGRTIAQISKELGVDYWLVWNHVRSWQGTKWVITNRLKQLAKEQDHADRERMVNEIAECVDYLYYQGKQLGSQVERARKVLNG